MSEIVSAIIPVYNGQETIERAISSANYCYCDRILVYDDGSGDHTLDILEDLGKKYKKLEVYADIGLHMNRGVNYARNLLCEKAAGGLIIPLDCDDEMIDMRRLRDAWQPNTFVYGDYNITGSNGNMIVKGIPAGSLSRKELTGITFLFHFDDWKRVGGYDSDFAHAEDWGLQCAFVNAGVRPKYVETLVYHRYIKDTGNERSALAGEYWQHYRTMARRKYPLVFTGTV